MSKAAPRWPRTSRTGSSRLRRCPRAPTAHAKTLQWDPLFTPLSPSGGPGTWDNGTTANWSNGATDVIWSGGNTAVFGGTAGTVTVNGAIAGINGITFNTTGYTISGG